MEFEQAAHRVAIGGDGSDSTLPPNGQYRICLVKTIFVNQLESSLV